MNDVVGGGDYRLLTGDALSLLRQLPDESVHACVTSPPYYALRAYGTDPVTWADGWEGELGQEPTSEQFLDHLAEICMEVHRVLRPDGSFWLNIMDSYNSYNGNRGASKGVRARADAGRQKRPKGSGLTDSTLKHKDLMLVPGRLAKKLQEKGWYVRQDAIWSKAGGNCPRCYHRIERGNTIPESVRDRFTRAHEYVFLLTKKPRGYYFDVEAVKEPFQKSRRRDVFFIPTQSFKGAHYAVMPTALARLGVEGGTSEHGCCAKCGAPYKRVTKKGKADEEWKAKSGADKEGDYKGTAQKDYDGAKAQDASATKKRILEGMKKVVTTGWTKTCKCSGDDVVPAVILDPFSGAGTTGVAALETGRRYVGLEISETNNLEIAEPRLRATLEQRKPKIEIEWLPTTSEVYYGQAEEILPRIPDESVRLVLTDPPYNTSRANNFHTMGRTGIQFDWDGDFDQREWLYLVDRVVVNGGSMVVWNDWKNLGIVAHLLTDLGWDVKRNLVWEKTNPMPRNRDRSFVQRTEIGLWAVKKRTKSAKWVFNRDVSKGFEDGIFRYGVPRAKKDRPRHESKKPDELFQEIIRILSDPGDLVLDPFAGGGTTAYAAEVEGRRSISIEASEEWVAEARAHWMEGMEHKGAVKA